MSQKREREPSSERTQEKFVLENTTKNVIGNEKKISS